jgi:hypothetical protein
MSADMVAGVVSASDVERSVRVLRRGKNEHHTSVSEASIHVLDARLNEILWPLLEAGSYTVDALSESLSLSLMNQVLQGQSALATYVRQHLLIAAQLREDEAARVAGVSNPVPECAEGQQWEQLLRVFPLLLCKLQSRSSAEWTRLVFAARAKPKASRWILAHGREVAIRYKNLRDVRARLMAKKKTRSGAVQPFGEAKGEGERLGNKRDFARGVWKDVIKAICIQRDFLAINAQLHKLNVVEEVMEDDENSEKRDVVTKLQAMVRGKRGRKVAEHLQKLKSAEFAEENYQKVLQVQRLARQYLARKELHERVQRKSSVAGAFDINEATQSLLVSPHHRRLLLDGGATKDSMPLRRLTPNNPRLSFGSKVDDDDIQTIATTSTIRPLVTPLASVPSASPWKNRAYARKKMAEIRREHTVFFVTRGGHASMVDESSDEEQDDACIKPGEEASLDHHPLHGVVRGMLKEQSKKALKRARKMEKRA